LRVATLVGLLSQRRYAIYTAGNSLSLIGTWIHRLATAWLAWKLTHSPFWLGIVAASGFVPMLLVGPVGGVLADRYDQRWQIIFSQFGAFLLMLGLYGSYKAGLLDIGLLISFRVALTALVSLSQPARLALMPQLVGPEYMTAAISFGAVVFNLARFVGPGLAGLLIANGDFALAFLVNGISYLALVMAMLAIRLEPESRPRRRSEARLLRDLGASVAYIAGHAGITRMFVLFAVVVIAGRPVSEMLPAFVGAVFGRGPDGLAILTTSMALGSIAGGLWSTERNRQGLTRLAILSGGIYGICIGLFAFVPNFWVGTAIMTVASGLTVVNGVAAQTLVQTSVDPDMRGRVLSFWFVLSRGGPGLGALLLGSLSEWFGLAGPFAAGGALCLAASLEAWRRFGRIARELESQAPIPAPG
jgi:MFS family permease